ncbi:MAG: Asd/ArgC dimerization domain-containing protein, partial [Bacteroidota bacterium]
NLLPQIDSFLENGYTKEEMKMVNETRKILRDESIRITSTTVRVPVKGGHSESVNVEFKNDFELSDVRTLLSQMPGIVLVDDPSNQKYPMPLDAEGKDEVFVGRIRRDESQPKTLNMWVVADNLRKGAATNAIQIAEYLVSKGIIS